MTKKRNSRKDSYIIVYPYYNKFEDGGDTEPGPFSKQNIGSTLGGALGAVGSIVNAGVQNANAFGVNEGEVDAIEAQADALAETRVKSNTNSSLLDEWSTLNTMDNVSWEDIYQRNMSKGQLASNTIGAIASGASSGAQMGGGIGAIVGGVVGLGSALGGLFGGKARAKKKAKREADRLNEEINKANALATNAFVAKAESLENQNAFNAMQNIAAYGGKIHIKPENRGKFTRLKERTGKSATWFKEHGTPAQKKMATFALNARKWKHADGGPIFTNGGIWSNGLTYINEGGTHEKNPLEGIQLGVDNLGVPNLVEEGEVVYDDYVFSNRIKVPRKARKSLGLGKSKDITFADAARSLSKESEERPNDPISKRGLEDSMLKLQQIQELSRMKKNRNAKYSYGGKVGRKFDDGSFLQFSNPLGGIAQRLLPISGLPDFTLPEYKDYMDMTPRERRKRASSIISDIPLLNDNTLGIGTKTYEDRVAEGLLPPQIDYNIGSTITDSAVTGDAVEDPGEHSKGRTRGVFLRYAPVFGSALGLANDLFSKPDYTGVDTLLGIANDAGDYKPVDYRPIGNYLQYNPFDRDYYINKLNAQAGATKRAIMNSSSPSRNAALLAADYNTQNSLGDLVRTAEEYNLEQRQMVEDFNRNTNIINAEMGLKSAMANQNAQLKANQSRAYWAAKAIDMRNAIDAARSASASTNMTNLFNSLGDIGNEKFAMNMINSNPALYYTLSRRGDVGYKRKGGYLTINKKGR